MVKLMGVLLVFVIWICISTTAQECTIENKCKTARVVVTADWPVASVWALPVAKNLEYPQFAYFNFRCGFSPEITRLAKEGIWQNKFMGIKDEMAIRLLPSLGPGSMNDERYYKFLYPWWPNTMRKLKTMYTIDQLIKHYNRQDLLGDAILPDPFSNPGPRQPRTWAAAPFAEANAGPFCIRALFAQARTRVQNYDTEHGRLRFGPKGVVLPVFTGENGLEMFLENRTDGIVIIADGHVELPRYQQGAMWGCVCSVDRLTPVLKKSPIEPAMQFVRMMIPDRDPDNIDEPAPRWDDEELGVAKGPIID